MIVQTEYQNPNVYQAESKYGPSEYMHPISVRCPHCRELGTFNIVGRSVEYSKITLPFQNEKILVASMRTCPSLKCRGIVFTISFGDEVLAIEPPELIDFSSTDLPDQLATTLKEAIACHGCGAYRASAMMVRRLLEEICELNGATGGTLHQRLAALQSKIILPLTLFDAMSELKVLGNDAAHVEAREYNYIGRAESADCIEIAKEILKALYQLQGLLGRLQGRKKVSDIIAKLNE